MEEGVFPEPAVNSNVQTVKAKREGQKETACCREVIHLCWLRMGLPFLGWVFQTGEKESCYPSGFLRESLLICLPRTSERWQTSRLNLLLPSFHLHQTRSCFQWGHHTESVPAVGLSQESVRPPPPRDFLTPTRTISGGLGLLVSQTISPLFESKDSTLHILIFTSSYTFGVWVSLITYANLSKQNANLGPKLDERIPSYSAYKISRISLP